MSSRIDRSRKTGDWYLSQCNGDWEHAYGVKIDTLDNPGWTLEVEDTVLLDYLIAFGMGALPPRAYRAEMR